MRSACRSAPRSGPTSRTTWLPACDLIRGLAGQHVLADRAYDADSLHDIILDQGGVRSFRPDAIATISTATTAAYKQRWGIEDFFAQLKQWRRIAIRYGKLAANFLRFVKLASIMFWLK